ncbi:MAG: response regulator, partial [Coriobacteriales bacterium]|nr:response regulator [Coriobacteriales bacterium]
DFSKIEAGKLGLVEEYFDFRGLLEGLQSLFELLMSQKELAFHARFAPDLPQVVYADPKRLRQILTNLVNNAYKYTPSGWVDFIVARTPDGQIRFDIRDTGIGIREQDLGKLFQAFEQVDIQRNRHISGTGLGLAITRQLAELMGGSVGVSSVYGEGSTFWVTLPLREGRPEDLPHVEATCYEFTAPAARILIADDVPMNIEIAEFMLESYEITAERAVDGEQALRQVAAQHFDLILMDHMMPRMDGVEATRRIRQLPADGPTSPQVPIIAMTANAGIGVENMFLDAGFDGYIAKPMETCAFSSALYHHLPRQLIRE